MIIESRDIVLFEDIFPYKQKETRFLEKEHMKYRSGKRTIVNAEIVPRRTKRSKIPKSFDPNSIAYVIESEPQTFKEDISTPKAQT